MMASFGSLSMVKTVDRGGTALDRLHLRAAAAMAAEAPTHGIGRVRTGHDTVSR